MLSTIVLPFYRRKIELICSLTLLDKPASAKTHNDQSGNLEGNSWMREFRRIFAKDFGSRMNSCPRTLDKISGLEMDDEPRLSCSYIEITAIPFYEQPKSCSLKGLLSWGSIISCAIYHYAYF